MKNLFNKFMMAMVAVVMVIGFSAFKSFEQSDDRYWYLLSPDGDILEPTEEVNICYNASEIFCAVGFLEDPGTNVPEHLSEIPSSEDFIVMYKPF